jgi:outer membrane protein assembly factor BamB
MKTKFIFILCLLVLYTNVRSQNIKEATWIASIGQPVWAIHGSQLNVPLVETRSNNLFALEPATGEILWTLKLNGTISTLDPIAGTPFSLLDSARVLDVSNGKTIDLRPWVQGRLKSLFLIPESYDLVLYARNPDNLVVIDLFNFGVRWSKPLNAAATDKSAQAPSKSKFGGAFAQLKDNINTTNAQTLMLSLECPPITNKAGGLIIANYGKLTNYDSKGEVIWQVEQPKKKKSSLVKVIDNYTALLVDEEKDQFYIQKSKMLTAVKLSDGSMAWPDFFEVKGTRILDTQAGLLPLPMYEEGGTSGGSGGMFSKSKLSLADYTTGKAMWPAELELKGFIDRYQVLPDGNVAIVTYNQTNSKFQIIDVKAGKLKYPEEIKLKGRVTNFLVGKEKILFNTSKGIDLIDFNSGNDLLPKMQKFDNDADIFTIFKGALVYNIDAKNRKVYKTDLLKDNSSEIIRSFKFQTNEPLTKYDVLENGNLFLGSAHHFQLYSPSGELLADKPFDYSGRGMDRYMRVMEQMDKAVNTLNMVESIAASGLLLGIAAPLGMSKEGAQDAYDLIAPEIQIHNLAVNQRAAKYYLGLKRVGKDTDAPGSFFVRRNKEAKADYLSFVSKADGSVIFDIPLAEDAKSPEFAINEVTGTVYYAPQFVNQDNAPFQAIFKKDKLKEAQENNKKGFVAAYTF